MGIFMALKLQEALDVFKLTPSKFLTEQEINQASNAYPLLGPMVFNPQQQIPMIWPESSSGR